MANPIGTILSGALMLEHLGLPDEAGRVREAVDATTASGVRTRDVGGTATTDEVISAIIGYLHLRGTRARPGRAHPSSTRAR